MWYGIPGHMVQVDDEKSIAQLTDPVPGFPKQLVTYVPLTSTHIQYEQEGKWNSKELHLPWCDNEPYHTFLFYCHTPNAGATYRENFGCFFQHARPQKEPGTLCVILLNVEDNFGSTCGVEENTILIRRPNLGLDFGAYADGLHFTRLANLCQKKDVHVFFLNDTIYGPLFPPYIVPKPNWIQVFKNMITMDTKLAGISINCYYGRPHVQSMFMVMDHVGLQIGLDARVFVHIFRKIMQLIEHCELGFSKAVLAAGYNIDCAATLLRGIDYRDASKIPKDIHDIWWEPGYYAGNNVHPYDTIFVKTNRTKTNFCAVAKQLMQKNV